MILAFGKDTLSTWLFIEEAWTLMKSVFQNHPKSLHHKEVSLYLNLM